MIFSKEIGATSLATINLSRRIHETANTLPSFQRYLSRSNDILSELFWRRIGTNDVW
ncbi:Uncharacterised protein [Legionella pneumophila]|nr:Uncharacterised protein [Legionella pneumophila]